MKAPLSKRAREVFANKTNRATIKKLRENGQSLRGQTLRSSNGVVTVRYAPSTPSRGSI